MLAHIWVMAAHPDRKTLGQEEFLILMFLVYAATSDVPLPTAIPKELTKSVRKALKSESPSAKSADEQASSPSMSKARHSSGAAGAAGAESAEKPRKANDASASPTGSKKMKKWALSKEEKKKFTEVFAMHSQEGFVNGDTAVRVFGQSGLPRGDLASIWALSDMDRDQKLSQQEFCIAMHLISRRMQGADLPPTVPASLVLSASSDLSSSKKHSKGLTRTGQSSGATRSSSGRNVNQAGSRSSMIVTTATNADDPAHQNQHAQHSPGLQRSVSTLDNTDKSTSPLRQPIATRTMSGFASTQSYSASELPHYSGSIGEGSSVFNHSSSSLMSASRSSPPVVSLASYGVDDKIIPEYDSSVDLAKLESVTDLPTVRMLMMQLSEEVKSLGTALDKSQLQKEALNEKLASRMDQNGMSQRRRQNFETILRNYNQQLEADIALYESLKGELGEISSEIDAQQQQLNSPQYDLVQLRERRKQLHAEYGRVKAESNASHEEHTRLVLEVEKLKLAGAEQASNIDTHWSDHGFKEEPAVAFGDGDFSASQSSISGFQPSHTGVGANSSSGAFAPSFTFPSGGFGTGSGTMTPTIDDFDFNDGASEVGDEPDLDWLKPTANATSTPPSGNSDFFAAESANWADFSMQEDARQRERVATVSKSTKKSTSRKAKEAPKADPAKEKEKEKKKKKH